MRSIQQLTRQLGITFHSIDWLTLALTHCSVGTPNNERLEFLGDAVLGMVIAKALFDRFPNAKEGRLSRTRATLVRRQTLAELGKALQLSEYLILGPGELKSGGQHRDSIIADCVEAIIGAIHEDGGFVAAQDFVLMLYAARLDQRDLIFADKDAKTQLQEYLQSRQLALPEYHVLEQTGAPHCQHFLVQCQINSCGLQVNGEGGSRRSAEQTAAQSAIQQLQL